MSNTAKRISISLTPELSDKVSKAQEAYKETTGCGITLQRMATMGLERQASEFIREQRRKKESGQ